MICSEKLPVALAALAAAVAQDRGDDEIALIAAMLVQLGDSLAAILAARVCEKK